MVRSALLRAVLVLFIASGSSYGQVVRTWVSATGIDNVLCGRSNPCRTFAAAITAVDAGGEVVVLDSAGYGPVTINKSVALISPPGIYAAIAPTAGTAITIDSNLTHANITLLGLTLNGRGASLGIDYSGTTGETNNTLRIEKCTVSNFIVRGIHSTRNGRILIYDSVFSWNFDWSIFITGDPGVPPTALIRNVKMEASQFNGGGLVIDNATVLVSDSSYTGTGIGFWARAALSAEVARVSLDHCLVSSASIGAAAGGGVGLARLFIEDSRFAFNQAAGISAGIYADINSIVRVSGTASVGNLRGLFQANGGVIESRGNNSIVGNLGDIDGTIGSYAPM